MTRRVMFRAFAVLCWIIAATVGAEHHSGWHLVLDVVNIVTAIYSGAFFWEMAK